MDTLAKQGAGGAISHLQDATFDAPPREHIETIASRKIKGFLGTIDERGQYYDPVHKQNRSLSQHIIADYHGRFLIELIQNGHDAHDRSLGDGEIEVVLASDEGEFGTLYVANRGRPFRHPNAEALCEMGLSSKPPGEAVGNKGLGFRSVRHISDTPEIFSRANEGEKGSFDGYCFTFARDQELDPMLPDEVTRKLARSDLPAFYIPRWVEDEPDAVRRFGERGFSTVIRLPLRGNRALNTVRDEMLELVKADAPILLFLRRIRQLKVCINGERLASDNVDESLKRKEVHLADGLGVTFLDLGEGGRYWLARAEIGEAEMQAAVTHGLDVGALPESWRGWKGAGEVAIAVPVERDRATSSARLYTFLPMGRGATSPLNGHLHGSFFPSSNRMTLDPTIKVNALVLMRAVQLAARTAKQLQTITQEDKTDIDLSTVARIAVDLLVWTTPPSLSAGEKDPKREHSVDLGATMAKVIASTWSSASLVDAACVPCLGDWQGDRLRRPEFGPVRWSTPSIARRGTANGKSFTLEVIARHGGAAGVAPLWSGLGERRTDALVAFLIQYGTGRFRERMTTTERAIIAEDLARSLARSRQADWSRWTAFYSDLAAFVESDNDALSGREILICQDGTLRATRSTTADLSDGSATGKTRRRRNRLETSVFMPPRRGEAEESIGEELYPPAPVRDLFAFLQEALPWYGELSDARLFLEKRLAQPFESEALLTRISQIVERDSTRKVRVAGLRWSFTIWRRSVAIKRQVSLTPNYRLYVPTLDGEFIRASDAIFSVAWPDSTLGHKVQQFLELAPRGLTDLEGVRSRRLASPSNVAFGTKLVKEWTEFLGGIGVKAGLQPTSAKLDGYLDAARIVAFDFLPSLGIPTSVAQLLRSEIPTRPRLELGLPSSTKYEITQPIWWLPGQADIASFNDEAREAYAVLIVDWIERLESHQLSMVVRHQHNYRSDNRAWPTPLGAFLRSVAWVPTDEPGPDGPQRRHHKPSEIWLQSGPDRYPPFLRKPSFRFTRALDKASESALENLRRHAQFRTFNAADSMLEQVGFLADQFAEGGIRRFHERELVNLYNRGWARLVEQHVAGQTAEGPLKEPDRLLVRRRGELSVAALTGSDVPTVYVRDNTDSIAAGLVEVVGDPLLDIRATDPTRAGEFLRQLYGKRIRKTSELSYAIHIGNEPLGNVPTGPRLVESCPWLRLILAVALESLDIVDMNRLPADRSILIQTLERIELQMKKDVSFILEGRNVTPLQPQQAYAFSRAEGVPIIIVLGEGPLTWSHVEAALPAIGDVIEHSPVISHMRLLVRQLTIDGVPVDEQPSGYEDLLRLCRALDLNERASEAARASLGERLDRQLPWIRAVVHYSGGEPAYEKWMAVEAFAAEDRNVLLDAMRGCLPSSGFGAESVVEAVRQSFTVGELRQRLDLDFALFNESLVATRSAPDTDPEGQNAQLAFRIQDRLILITEALRNMVAEQIRLQEPDSRYMRAQTELLTLVPDPGWLMRFDRVPEDLLDKHLDSWLLSTGAPAMGSNPHGLDDVMTVRTQNTVALRRIGLAAQPLIRAWGVQNSVPTSEVWRDISVVESELRRRLELAGAFDSRAWTDAELLSWFSRLALWPDGMHLTLDRDVLGVAKTELEAQAENARAQKEADAREARSVRVNGEPRDPQSVDWLELSAELADGLSKDIRNRPIGTLTDLAPASPTRRRAHASGPGGGGPYAGVPQDKKDMIGRLGELTVYHWLRARQSEKDIDQCWVSSNGTPFTGRSGNDSLGYDFRIGFNNQTWYIEVKASTDDPCQFELGETEVRKARDVARSRSAERYIIAYVSNVGRGSLTTIDLLPNPLSPEADAVLSIVGDSIRYSFGRA